MILTKVSGKSYRVCTDAENDAYDELSFKTDASDVNFTDGTDVETNLSAIKGITSDMSCEDENIAISAKAVNDSLSSLFTTQTFSKNVTIGASPEVKDFEIDVSLDGYTPIGVIGTQTGNRYLVLYRQYIENNMFYGTLKNTNNGSLTVDVRVDILYQKNI